MSAKRLRIGIAFTAILSLSTPALAFDPLFPVEDPLQATPEAMATGVSLPRDSTPILCPPEMKVADPLTLNDAVDLALCNNPKAKSSWADIKQQAGGLGEAHAAYLPSVNGTLSQVNDQVRYPGSRVPSETNNRTTLQGTLSWRLFDFGGREANRQMAASQLAAALASHNATLQKILTAVIDSYFQALTAGEAVKAKAEHEAIARKTLLSAMAREERGASSQADRQQAKTALAKIILERNRAEGDYHKALSMLGYAMGLSGSVQISLQDGLYENTDEESRILSQWLEEAGKNHPAILAAREELNAAQNQVTVVRSVAMPSLDLAGNYYQNTRPGESVTPTETTETTIGISVKFPIFSGFSQTYKLMEAKAQVEQKEAALAETEHQIAMEIIKAYADVTSAIKNLEASTTLLEAAQSAQAVSQRRYDKGVADIIEILNTQAALADAQQERIRCVAEWRSARLRLLTNAGQMGRSSIPESIR